jgi:hypothetical protein
VRVMLMCSFPLPLWISCEPDIGRILPRRSVIVCRFDMNGNPLMHAICVASSPGAQFKIFWIKTKPLIRLQFFGTNF